MRFFPIISLIIVIGFGCHSKSEVEKEPWMNEPVGQWPDFALTNEVGFADTTYRDLANAFLVDTGLDTIGVTCKHMFMVFRKYQGMHSIDPGADFRYWKFYPRDDPDRSVGTKKLINRDSHEPIGQFNTLKNRDWIIFDIKENLDSLYPLKIRYAPVRKGEVVYAVGWGDLQKNNDHPARMKFQCQQERGNYFYARLLTTGYKPDGRSGSPVIDKNGYLVGLTSGAEGKLTVIGSTLYLKKLLDRYGVDYSMPGG